MIFKPIDKPRRVFRSKRKLGGRHSAFGRQQRRQGGANEVGEKWDHKSGKYIYIKNYLFGKVKSRKNMFASDHCYFDEEIWWCSIKQTEQENSL